MNDGTCFYKWAGDLNATDYRCHLRIIDFFFRNIYFHYICAVLLVLVLIISIFGKIKANYRWFILNQVLWDLFLSYDYLCHNNFNYKVSENDWDNLIFKGGTKGVD